MPGFDGTGPQGRGPMTGRGMGFCVLKESKDKPGKLEGFIGIQGMPIGQYGYGTSCTVSQFMYGRIFRRNFGCGQGFRGGRARFGG